MFRCQFDVLIKNNAPSEFSCYILVTKLLSSNGYEEMKYKQHLYQQRIPCFILRGGGTSHFRCQTPPHKQNCTQYFQNNEFTALLAIQKPSNLKLHC